MLLNKLYFLDIPWDKQSCIIDLFSKGKCLQTGYLTFYSKKSKIIHLPNKIKEEVKDDDLLLIYCNYEGIKEFIGFTRLLFENNNLNYSVKWPPFKDKTGNIGIKWEVPKPYNHPYEFFKVNRYGGDQDYPNLYGLYSNEKDEILKFLQQKVSNWKEIAEKIKSDNLT